MNPITTREARERFRARRGWPFLLFWVMWCGLAATLLVWISESITGMGFGQAFAAARLGRFLFDTGTLLLMTAVIFLVPGIAALSIVSEREKQTMHLLQVTLLSPRQLVLGKLSASMAYFGLLVVIVLPVMAIPLLFGGVPLGDLVGATFMTVVVAITVGSISVWVSSWARSARAAVAGAYLLSFLLAFFTFFLILGELFLQTNFRNEPDQEIWTAIPNPYMALVSAVEHPLEFKDFNDFTTPYAPAYFGLLAREGLTNSGRPADRVVQRDNRFFVKEQRLPLWLLSTAFYGLITYLSLRQATTHVRAPGPRVFKVRRIRNPA